jgi:hypothetical protein
MQKIRPHTPDFDTSTAASPPGINTKPEIYNHDSLPGEQNHKKGRRSEGETVGRWVLKD